MLLQNKDIIAIGVLGVVYISSKRVKKNLKKLSSDRVNVVKEHRLTSRVSLQNILAVITVSRCVMFTIKHTDQIKTVNNYHAQIREKCIGLRTAYSSAIIRCCTIYSAYVSVRAKFYITRDLSRAPSRCNTNHNLFNIHFF